MEKKTETAMIGYIGTTMRIITIVILVSRGSVGITEKKMETTIVYGGYIGIVDYHITVRLFLEGLLFLLDSLGFEACICRVWGHFLW